MSKAIREGLGVLERLIARKKKEIRSLKLVIEERRKTRFKRLLTGVDK